MGLFDIFKGSAYEDWKNNFNGTSMGLINRHISMIQVVERILNSVGNPKYAICDINLGENDDHLRNGLLLNADLICSTDIYTYGNPAYYALQQGYLDVDSTTYNEEYAKSTIWSDLSDEQIKWARVLKYTKSNTFLGCPVDSDDEVIHIHYDLNINYKLTEEDYVIRFFTEKIYAAFPNSDVLAHANGIHIQFAGPSKLEFSKHLKR